MTAPSLGFGTTEGDSLSFRVGRPIASEEATYASAEGATEAPLAQAILSVPGIREVTLAGETVTVIKDPDRGWDQLADRLQYAVTTALAAPPEPETQPASLSDDAMYQLVDELFASRINPSIAAHGGKVELLDVQEGQAVVRMMGGCQGCGMASVTLRQGIENQLRRMVPGFRGITDITDHSSGENPYYR